MTISEMKRLDQQAEQEIEHVINNSRKTGQDLYAKPIDLTKWDSDKPIESLNYLFKIVEDRTIKAIEYYFNQKRSKKWWSLRLRILSVISFILAGLCPAVMLIWKLPSLPALGYVFAASAAACIGIDKYLSLSSSWMRYVYAALILKKHLSEFQIQWFEILTPDKNKEWGKEKIIEALNEIKNFQTKINLLLERETQEWFQEYEGTLSLLESRVVEALRQKEQAKKPQKGTPKIEKVSEKGKGEK